MKAFAGIVNLTRRDHLEAFRQGVRSHPYCRGGRLADVGVEHCVMLAGADRAVIAPALKEVDGGVAVGMVRLSNRQAIAERLGCDAAKETDLALAAALIRQWGPERVGDLIGDFAFACWSPLQRTLVAARDAVGVRPFYFRMSGDAQLAFASRGELLADPDRFDHQYLVEAVACSGTSGARTPYADVIALEPGHVLVWRRGVLSVRQYWDPHAIAELPPPSETEREQCEQFRELLFDGVRAALVPGGQTWAQLSGGLDSSSVVSSVEWLAREEGSGRLGGTVTFVDPIGSAANERAYSDAVVGHYGLRNELVSHQIAHERLLRWLPRIDNPTGLNHSIALRDQRVAELVRQSGGRVLLTGLGGDNLVLGTMFFFADWCATGRIWAAIREMAHRAALGRASFWELAYQNAVLPLLPSGARRARLRQREAPMPPWLGRSARRTYRVDRWSASVRYYAGRPGRKFAFAHAEDVRGAVGLLDDGVVGDTLEVRHPFLHRPLVEFALRLPPDMMVRPHAHKWILREAMRGVLPELVRTRVGKGDGAGLSLWGIQHNDRLIAVLLKDSLLGSLGLIEPRAVATAIRHAGDARSHPAVSAMIQRTLDTELWLRVQSGRWTSAASGNGIAAAG